MGYKKQVRLLLILTFVLTVGIFAVFYFEKESLSILSELFGKRIYYSDIAPAGESIFFLSATLLLSLIPLYFLKEGIYKAWRKFAVIYLPIAILWIAASDPYGGGGYVGMLDSREQVTFFVSGLFLLISLILIIYKSIKLRKK